MATGDPLHTGAAVAGLYGYDLHEGVALQFGKHHPANAHGWLSRRQRVDPRFG
jgi:hypothetical protein